MLAHALNIKAKSPSCNFRAGILWSDGLSGQLSDQIASVREPTPGYRRTQTCGMLTATAADEGMRIMGRFNLKKISLSAKLLRVQLEKMGNETKHNAQE
jgi:hypothetical protein